MDLFCQLVATKWLRWPQFVQFVDTKWLTGHIERVVAIFSLLVAIFF